MLKKWVLRTSALGLAVAPVVALTLSCGSRELKVYTLKNDDITPGSNGKLTISKETLEWLRDQKYHLVKNGSGKAMLKIESLPQDFWEYFPNTTEIAPDTFRGWGLSEMPRIPSRITKIGAYAFASNRLKSVNFESDSQLRTIERHAFYDNEISSIWSSDSQHNNASKVEYIGWGAFKNNKIGGYLYLPTQLRTLETEAFAGNSISRVSLSPNLQTVGAQAFWQKNALYRVKIYNQKTRFDGEQYDPKNPKAIQAALKRVFGPNWNIRSEIYLSTLNLVNHVGVRRSKLEFKVDKPNDQDGSLTLKAIVSKAGKYRSQEIQVHNFLTDNSNPAITAQEREQVQKLIRGFKTNYQTSHTDKTIYGVNASGKKLATPADLGIQGYWPNKQIQLAGLNVQILVKNRDFKQELLECAVVVKSTNGYNLVHDFTVNGFKPIPSYANAHLGDEPETSDGDQDQVDMKALVDEYLAKITAEPYQTVLKTTLPSEIGITGLEKNYKTEMQLGISKQFKERLPEVNPKIKITFELKRVEDKTGEIDALVTVSHGDYSPSAVVLISGFQTTQERKISDEKDVDEIIKELSEKLLTNQINKTPSQILEMSDDFWEIGSLVIDNYYTKDDTNYGDRAGQVKNVKLAKKSYTKFAFAEVTNDDKTTGIPYDKWW